MGVRQERSTVARSSTLTLISAHYILKMHVKTNDKLPPLETQPAASIFALSIRNIQRPGIPTLELFGSSSTCRVRDPGILKYRTPSPALKPA